MVIAVFVLDTVCSILWNVEAFLCGRDFVEECGSNFAFSFAILRDFPSLRACFLGIA
jgi:hypothetical protein